MKPDQITALAREYGEYVANNPIIASCLDTDEKKDINIRANARRAKDVIKWMTDRYCLVEKDKVRGEYLLARADYRTSNGMQTVQEYHRGEMSMIERLFPEIAKEVEG